MPQYITIIEPPSIYSRLGFSSLMYSKKKLLKGLCHNAAALIVFTVFVTISNTCLKGRTLAERTSRHKTQWYKINLGNDSSILWHNKNPFLLPIIAGAVSSNQRQFIYWQICGRNKTFKCLVNALSCPSFQWWNCQHSLWPCILGKPFYS